MKSDLNLLVSVARLSALLHSRLSEIIAPVPPSELKALAGWPGLERLDNYLQLTIDRMFVDIIHRVPGDDEEADYIVAIVELMLSENPSLSQHLETRWEEHEAILNELKQSGLKID